MRVCLLVCGRRLSRPDTDIYPLLIFPISTLAPLRRDDGDGFPARQAEAGGVRQY